MAELLIAGAAIGAAGEIQAGREAAAEAKSQENISKYNAAVQRREALARRQKTAFEQRRQAKAAERQRSKLQAAIGLAGGVPTGAVEAEQAAESELENLLIGYEGQVAEQRALSQAELDIAQAGIYKKRGKAARTASYFGAGRTLLTGFGMAGMAGRAPVKPTGYTGKGMASPWTYTRHF